MNSRKDILKRFEDSKTEIDARLSYTIKKHRKGKTLIRVVDENGNPIKGAHVTVNQKSHDFKYGANIFMLDEFETEEKNALYRKHFKEICNIATLPFYWKDLEPRDGELRFDKGSVPIYRRPPIDLCIEYCNENGIEPKEHCLFYETHMPEWVDTEDADKLKSRYERRIFEIAERYRDKIRNWEVTNETLYFWDKTSKLYLEPDLIEWAFETARKYLPDNRLVINEAHCNVWNVFNENRSAYYMQIERAMSKGASIDAIGMQFHMFYPREDEEKETEYFYNPEHLYRVMERYDDFKKPIQLTEITIPAYSKDEEDEWIQAEIMKYLYTIWFSHPSVEAIQYWNLTDGYAAFAPQGDMTAGENYYHGGLFRFDMTPKPAFFAIRDLFNKTWHTSEVGLTNSDGAFEFDGFYGDYDITISLNGKEITNESSLNKGSKNEIKIVLK